MIADFPIAKGATFSPCGAYRYDLTRHWGDAASARIMGLCGANPSTASHLIDDNTIRRDIGFAQREGFDGLAKGNVSAYCATDPRNCPPGAAGFGPDNEAALRALARRCPLIVCCWGTVADPTNVRRTLTIFREEMATLMCFGLTLAGHPKHPLYLPASAPLIEFNP